MGGGYKYCQLGEGNAFLRVPPGTRLRPVVTGWFAEFAELAATPGAEVGYGEGHWRFAGATYDPTSHYRGAAVFDFFAAHGLDPGLLRAVSQEQIRRLVERFDALDLPPERIRRASAAPLTAIGGFLALEAPQAESIVAALRARGVFTDCRGPILRLGPAPYLATEQLDAAMELLGETVRALG